MTFWRCESGATAIEYGLLVALLGAFLAGVFTLLGTRLDALFTLLSGRFT